MKYTQYFLYSRQRPDRAEIKDEWILEAIQSPIQKRIQSDVRIQRWVWIGEKEKYLRVILLEDGENRTQWFL